MSDLYWKPKPVFWRKIMLMLHAKLAGAMFALALTTSGATAQNIVASADGERSGIRIDITELKRASGNTVTMKFTLFNGSGEEVSPYALFESSDVRHVHLIDAAGKKKYTTIMDADSKCVCAANLGGSLETGKSINLWARFPAPPADVAEVSVVFPHFIPTDAPIAQ